MVCIYKGLSCVSQPGNTGESIKQDDNDLVKVPGRCNLRMLLPQLNGQFSVAFQADPPAILQENQQGKHLVHDPENQSCVIEEIPIFPAILPLP